MNMLRRLPTIVLCLLILPACDQGNSSLGDLPGGDGTASSAGESEDGAPPPDDGSPAPLELGTSCQPDRVSEIESLLLESDNPQCMTGLCLYADTIYADRTEACTEDAECSGFGEGVICDLETNRCQLDPAHVTARSMCTQTCEVDEECVGAEGSPCAGGFSCAPVSSLGSLCCQKVCVCNDDIDLAHVTALEASCADGTQEGCCDGDAPSPACGM